jgi:hypothetical protein
METDIRSPLVAERSYAVAWGAIAAGAVTSAALTLMLAALGAGLGLSSISPWEGVGISATTFKNATGIYLVCVAVMASAIGGYLAARLRSRWVGLHNNEVFFRDTAHGLVAWVFATLLSAAALGTVTTNIVGGAAAGLGNAAGQAAQAVNPADIYVDRLFRVDTATPAGAPAAPPPAANAAGTDAARAEVLRLWTASFRNGTDLSAPDRTYVAQLISRQTGISQADAERRVNDTIVQAKAAADQARSSAAKLAFWLTASLLFGAFAAALAAVEGGQLRDGTWNERVLVPRAL